MTAARAEHAEKLESALAAANAELASRAESLIRRAADRAASLEKTLEARVAEHAEATRSAAAKHAEAMESKRVIVANVVTACKQEEAKRFEAAAAATRAEARARAAESALERARGALRDAEDARRDAEARAEASARKAARYREENESLVSGYDRSIRRLARASSSAEEGGMGAGSVFTRLSPTPRRSVGYEGADEAQSSQR